MKKEKIIEKRLLELKREENRNLIALEQGFGENTALAGFMTREATYIVGGSSLM